MTPAVIKVHGYLFVNDPAHPNDELAPKVQRLLRQAQVLAVARRVVAVAGMVAAPSRE